MKKLLKMLGLLVIAGSLFFSCSNGNSDNNGGDAGNGGGNNAPADNGGNSGSGNSQTAGAIQLSDGNWTVRMKTSVQGMEMYVTLHATVSGNGKNITYTSGTTDMAMSMAGYAGFTDAQMAAVVADMNKTAAAQGLTATYYYDKNSHTLFMCYEMTPEELAQASGDLDINEIPSSVNVTSNADKTEYTFTVTEQGATVTYTITKDK